MCFRRTEAPQTPASKKTPTSFERDWLQLKYSTFEYFRINMRFTQIIAQNRLFASLYTYQTLLQSFLTSLYLSQVSCF